MPAGLEIWVVGGDGSGGGGGDLHSNDFKSLMVVTSMAITSIPMTVKV